MDIYKKYYLLASPFTVTALLLLILNDHYLKQYFPNFITGKLSDFVGLFIFPVFLYVLFGRFLKHRLTVEIIIAFSALFFIIIQIEIILTFIINFFEIVNLPKPNLVADATDLIALIVLPFSYMLIKNTQLKNYITFKKYKYLLLVIVYSFAITATSFVDRFIMHPNKVYDRIDKTGKVLFLFEEALLEEGIEIRRRDKIDDKLIYTIRFNEGFYIKNQLTEYSLEEIYGTVEFLPSDSKDSLSITKIELEGVNSPAISAEYNNEILGNKLINEYILKPFEDKLK